MSNGEQNAPMQHGSQDASTEAKKQGILVQVSADMVGRPVDEVVEMLRQRFTDVGIDASADELRSLAGSLPSVDNQGQAENAGPRTES